MMRLILSAVLALLVFKGTARGEEFQVGNILVSTGGALYEVTPKGKQVQSIPIPYPGQSDNASRNSSDLPRDIVMDAKGQVHVFNGGAKPLLSTYSPSNAKWEHRSIPGWSSLNLTYGGIAVLGEYVFLTDMETGGGGQAKGLIRYNLSDSTFTRFAENISPIDLTLGYDGDLYALYGGGSPEGLDIDVYNPKSLEFIKSISLAKFFGHTGHRTIAVDPMGAIFIADFDGEVSKISAKGIPLATAELRQGKQMIDAVLPAKLSDLNLDSSGMVAISSAFGDVFISNKALESPFQFAIGKQCAFVCFVVKKTP